MAETTDPPPPTTTVDIAFSAELTTIETEPSNARRYVITASIDAAGSLQLSGEGLSDNVIEIPAGEAAAIEITDAKDYYVYGIVVLPRGEHGGCWARDAAKGMAHHTFENVREAVNSVVFAAETNDTAKIKYGPVITVKPKG